MKQYSDRSLRTIVVAAIDEATKRGAGSVESEHLLLALSGTADPRMRRALADLGLDRDSLERLIASERHRSLEAAGVQPLPAWALAAHPRSGRPRWGASIRESLAGASRIAKGAGRRRMTGGDVLLALATVEFGTVARVLALAGVTREAVESRLRAA